MPFVKFPQESLKIALMFGRCFVISLFELGVADKSLAMFAPIFRLYTDNQSKEGATALICTYR